MDFKREDKFVIPEVQVEHKPKVTHSHLATEFQQTNRQEVAAEITRNLMPWAREICLYDGK